MKFGKGIPLETRFWANVVKTEGCWRWTAATNKDGYGRIFGNGKGLTAHRVAYSLLVGQIPDGLAVLHRCDNPPCCNPAHLFLGTNVDNQRDKFAKGRENMPSRSGSNHWMRRSPDRIARGSAFGRSRLTDSKVADMRAQHAAGVPLVELAKQFDTGYSNVHLIVSGKTWKHVGHNQKESS